MPGTVHTESKSKPAVGHRGYSGAILHADPAYVEALYRVYRSAPERLPEEWRSFFAGFETALALSADGLDGGGGRLAPVSGEGLASIQVEKELRLWLLVERYRQYGHFFARVNPLGYDPGFPRRPAVGLDAESVGLTAEDLAQSYVVARRVGPGFATARELIDWLGRTYCGAIGFEFHAVADQEKRAWLIDQIEKRWTRWRASMELRTQILDLLNRAEVFEQFLNARYQGQKRFSLEGGDVLIPLLGILLREMRGRGAREMVLGMAHRGRLNVLANILQKDIYELLSEFEDVPPVMPLGDGDVKYHRGYAAWVSVNGERVVQEEDNGQSVYVKLLPNPSHLESVNPVVQGYARGLIDYLYEGDWRRVLPILIHGDAALSGQGVVYESVQMMRLPAYRVGGILHIVINNQIGFTVLPEDGRSSWYPTGVASVVETPVFHVNGDDPEAVIFAGLLALDYRYRFQEDAWIDIWCYRKYGHNEGDDPSFTQPRMYELIRKHRTVRELYLEKLAAEGEAERQLVEKKRKEYWQLLQEVFRAVKREPRPYRPQKMDREWAKLNIRRSVSRDQIFEPLEEPTTIDGEVARWLLEGLTTIPEGVRLIPRMERLIERQRVLWLEEGMLDWAGAELLAYASLAYEGCWVRLAGEDSRRGTFAHRHAYYIDAETERRVSRFAFLDRYRGEGGAVGRVEIWDSHLSEFAALGFEYGYSLVSPRILTIWEAQFGDFANGAQVIIDQYIMTGEDKWSQVSGIVLFLPHGYEGQGPEHSSARIERFLQMAADLNVFLVNCTTPANFFHLLRRHMKLPFRKPLIVFTPKSLLRHPRARSSLREVLHESQRSFTTILDDPRFREVSSPVARVLLCSGKVYYDLLAYQEAQGIEVPIIRIEQLYPFDREYMEALMRKYRAEEWVWVQEEPANMGAWFYMKWCDEVPWGLRRVLKVVARPASASPASGFYSLHRASQEELVRLAHSSGRLPEYKYTSHI